MPLIVHRESDFLPVFKEDISTACPHENSHEMDDIGDIPLQGYGLAVSIQPYPNPGHWRLPIPWVSEAKPLTIRWMRYLIMKWNEWQNKENQNGNKNRKNWKWKRENSHCKHHCPNLSQQYVKWPPVPPWILTWKISRRELGNCKWDYLRGCWSGTPATGQRNNKSNESTIWLLPWSTRRCNFEAKANTNISIRR